MPRPGPRPYECVRRSWHSDRHQPMRGSVIQEMFRLANEVHGPATRKNKEWQEKLPLVVLKAEEIMYSKASSESEYGNLKTLWERSKDAVDTIIRRDNGAESGDLLQPCIEAALNLGCIPRRASRSQRHGNPRCYLSSRMQEATDATTHSLKTPDINMSQSSNSFKPPQAHSGDVYGHSQQMVPWYMSLASSPTTYNGYPEVGSVTSLPPPGQRAFPIPISICEFPTFSHEDFPHFGQARGMSFHVEYCTRSSLARAYPLYYGTDHPSAISHCSVSDPMSYNHHMVTSSSTHLPIVREVKAWFLHDFLGNRNSVDTAEDTSNLEGPNDNTLDCECNLSLHLGLPPVPCLDGPDIWAHEVEDVGSSSTRCSNKFYDASLTQSRAKCSVSSKGKGLVFLS